MNIKYPALLTPMDIELVNAQCVNQGATSVEQIEGFAKAYSRAKATWLGPHQLLSLQKAEEVMKFMFRLALLIEPGNRGFRLTPVRFADMQTAMPWENIPRAMESFSHAYADFIKNPVEDEVLNATVLYREFEKIHPWVDGNGRTGDLLWKIARARVDGQWPEKLPPDVFGSHQAL